jgi:two-component system nitrate/nitrite response regulator NarL
MVGTEVGTNEHVSQANSSYTPRLSARQQSILRCLIQGDSNKTIARKMAIAEATVKVHVKAILRRIRVHNRTQAAIWAMSNGPFISAKDDASPALEKLPVEPLPSLDVAQVLSAEHKNGSTSLPTLKLNGASHVALPSIVRLVKGIGSKND